MDQSTHTIRSSRWKDIIQMVLCQEKVQVKRELF